MEKYKTRLNTDNKQRHIEIVTQTSTYILAYLTHVQAIEIKKSLDKTEIPK